MGEGYNQVYKTFDPTCHAEVAAIRDATSKLQTFSLEGCDVYTSNEPCPMCLRQVFIYSSLSSNIILQYMHVY